MMGDWTLFSNHGHVLVCLARNREARLRDVARDVGITERAVQKIVRELQLAGFITIAKHGRCNRYNINARKNLRHDLEARCSVGRLMQLLTKPEGRGGKSIESEAAAPPPEPQKQARAQAPAPRNPKPQTSPAASHQTTQPEPRKKASPKGKKTAEPNDPGDTRQQGSLF